MTTVHLVYPHGPSISCPNAIGRKLAERLRPAYDAVLHDWDSTYKINPRPGDFLVGHAHPAPWTTFRRSMKDPAWGKIVVLEPYNDDLKQMAWADRTVSTADQYLAICGNYWFNRVPDSEFFHWLPKMVHVDLAVDRIDFPPLKESFNSIGNRKFVYIGSTTAPKNTSYLTEIARLCPDCEIAWIGGKGDIPGLTRLGIQDFSTEVGKKAVAEFDFLLTVGRADANPTTILEAMAWGLIPVCTKQSGYEGYEGIVNVPLDDAEAVAQTLHRLQEQDEANLVAMQRQNWRALDAHFNWDRFAKQVLTALETERGSRSDGSAPLRRMRLLAASAVSSNSIFSPRQMRIAVSLLFRPKPKLTL